MACMRGYRACVEFDIDAPSPGVPIPRHQTPQLLELPLSLVGHVFWLLVMPVYARKASQKKRNSMFQQF